MKTDFSINVNVSIGVTPEVVALVTSILTKQPTATVEAPASEQPAAEAPAEGKALTVEDVREAMRRARVRIEGEDWETNTTGEGYTKYHRQLNATFKNIAALLGSDKPSTLSEENYASFIKQCDELIVGADGTITTKCPF